MKKKNIYRIVWVSGIYIFLILVLFLVIIYKVKWEGKDLNKYLYFYDCSGSLCTSELKPRKYYSKYLCNKICPRINNILDNDIVILEGIYDGAIFNYKDGNIINNNYSNYLLINNNILIVSDGSKKGLIDLSGNIILNTIYDDISEYFDDYVSVKKDSLWGIENIHSDKSIECMYDELKYINSNILLVKKDNVYYFINYDNNKISDNIYNYLFYIDGYILSIINKNIDILDNNLHSRLVMKIGTTYEYINDLERKSLNITSDSEYIYFNLYTLEGYVRYKYSKERNAISY